MRIIKIIDRYLLTEFFSYFIIGSIVFIIFVMGNNILFNMLDFFIDKKIPFPIAIRIIGYQIPGFTVFALPLATLLATLLSISRMSRDSEIDVMRTSGISFFRILLPFVIFGAIISWVGFITIQKIVPWSNHRSQNLWRQFVLSEVSGNPQSNIFFQGQNGKYFYIRYLDPKTHLANGIVVYDTKQGDFPRVISARTGKWEKNYLYLEDGYIHNFNRNGEIQLLVKFRLFKVNIERQLKELFGEQKTTQEMDSLELSKQIKIFKKSGINTASLETDLHFKISIPVASLVCVLVGVPLSIKTGRTGMFTGIVICLCLICLYWVLMIISTSLGHKQIISPALAAWSQNILFLLISLFLIIRTRR